MAGRKARSIYNTRAWKEARKAALDAAGWRCERCHVPGRLEVHHKISIFEDFSLALTLSNLEVLCRSCHIAHHRAEKDTKSEARVPEPWLDFVNELS